MAESQYGKLVETWDGLNDEDKATLQNNLASIQSEELYKKIHRDWAEVCRKQNRTTEARRVLTKIGEAPAEEPERPARTPPQKVMKALMSAYGQEITWRRQKSGVAFI